VNLVPFSRRASGKDTQHPDAATREPFDARFVELFNEQYARLARYFGRLTNDADVAADIVQAAFVKLYQRGSLPDAPAAWLVSVAMNLFRNAQSSESRRQRLLTMDRAKQLHARAAPPPDVVMEADELQQRVQRAIRQLPERDQQLLLLRAEGFSYRDIAGALALHEASIGTLIARAQREFRQRYEDEQHAP